MPTSVIMPRLGESVTEGTVTRWLKQIGDRVEAGEPLVEISTDKVDTEVSSPASGTLLEIKVGKDQTVDIGVELAVIDEGREAGKNAPAAGPAAAEPPAPATAAAVEPAPGARAAPAIAAGGGGGEEVPRPRATPFVRKLAHEHGVNLFTVTGTGVHGRISKSDVLAAASGGLAPVAPALAIPAPAAPVPAGLAPVVPPWPLLMLRLLLPRRLRLVVVVWHGGGSSRCRGYVR